MPETVSIIFGGPSLRGVNTQLLLGSDVRGPARRGDLEALAQREKPGTVLLVDGLFGRSMAVTPTECKELLIRGWTLLGCSSMGALRASELWSLGMIGVGDVFQMLRSGRINNDDEVAVAYTEDHERELTVSLVHVRAVIAHVNRTAKPSQVPVEDRRWGHLALETARQIYWMERTPDALGRAWRSAGLSPRRIRACLETLSASEFHPKKIDAKRALMLLAADVWPSETPDNKSRT